MALGAAGFAGVGANWAEAGRASVSRAAAAIANRVWSMRFPQGEETLGFSAKLNGTIDLKPVPRLRDAP
ncbi:hypothetical protein ACVWZ6_003489 [Bradyrhizobium sp. GM6.1]